MIETEMQALIVSAVVEGGGRALKFNNRFLIGVCDLFLKLPGHQPMLLEAKKIDLSVKSIAAGFHISDVGCTKKQRDFLRDWSDAGMLTGVVSFIQVPGREPIRTLRMAIYSHQEMLRRHWSVHSEDHTPLGEKSERFTNIREQLIRFANG